MKEIIPGESRRRTEIPETNMNTAENKDIRIGTLVNAGMKSPEYIREIIDYGFESFSIIFWQSTEGVDWHRLAERLREIIEPHDAVISSLAVYGNPLEKGKSDLETLKGIKECIDNAHLFGTDIVGGFTGRIRNRPIDESMSAFKNIFGELARQAADNGVRIAFENCDMEGNWASGDWNIAHNPTAWEMMFNELPNENLGLEWEPCHQLVNLIDPMPQLREWTEKIFHVHGKDANVHWDIIRKYGIHSKMSQESILPGGVKPVPPFTCHRTPGFGDSDWTAIISELRRGGYRGSIDIEGWHDPVYKDELEMTGQVHALNYLIQCRGGNVIENPDI